MDNMENVVEEVTKEVAGNGSLLKDVAKVGLGAVVGVGTYVLVRKAVGKVSDAIHTKKVEAAEPVDIDETEVDVEVVE